MGAHYKQLVRIEFVRGTSIKENSPRHPWHWAIIIQGGHVYSTSDSFETLQECMSDFTISFGYQKLSDLEDSMSRMYTENYQEGPYNINQRNPRNE